MELFTRNDFKVFDMAGFSDRMAAIRTRIRPKLTSIGESLAPRISELVDTSLYVHVAKHARRTVNAPDDTWAALGANQRGYKKDVHFKIAVSRNCVRLLFEAGPEYYAKTGWAQGWQREFKDLASGLQSGTSLAWFKNEHDEAPGALVSSIPTADLKKLGEELTRRKDGQVVFGRRIDAKEFLQLSPKQFEKIAVEAFKPLAPLFHIHDARALAHSSN
jgi:uncharacterized protein YktB (UPF0637 family)